MREDIAYSMVCTLYATFGKAAPSRGAAVFQAVYNRIADISDQAADYITEHLQDGDELPKNLGKAILAQFFNWQAENGIKAEKRYCQTCQGKEGWETIRFHPRFKGVLVFAWAPCPDCSAHLIPHGFKPMYRKDLEEDGALVIPPNYPGGRSGYCRDYGLINHDGESVVAGHLPKNVHDLFVKMNHRTGYARDYGQADAQKAPREQGGIR